ncbi:Aste57867_2230 [Aphanomyces stellatus]|uniref:Aste57867_2230 protein n=1 Tax=Aphanomyces stellatus TaxID=120398 RepID=A0A485K865_9STRA|nr:hypothetical protein As57867_002225 [Aphanomyces stellatus]VFT79433.1 Aste57867_2230 [Aphanomyces stellatus]
MGHLVANLGQMTRLWVLTLFGVHVRAMEPLLRAVRDSNLTSLTLRSVVLHNGKHDPIIHDDGIHPILHWLAHNPVTCVQLDTMVFQANKKTTLEQLQGALFTHQPYSPLPWHIAVRCLLTRRWHCPGRSRWRRWISPVCIDDCGRPRTLRWLARFARANVNLSHNGLDPTAARYTWRLCCHTRESKSSI